MMPSVHYYFVAINFNEDVLLLWLLVICCLSVLLIVDFIQVYGFDFHTQRAVDDLVQFVQSLYYLLLSK